MNPGGGGGGGMSFRVRSARAVLATLAALYAASIVFHYSYLNPQPKGNDTSPWAFAATFAFFISGILLALACVFPISLPEAYQSFVFFVLTSSSAATVYTAFKWSVTFETADAERRIRTTVASGVAAMLFMLFLQFWWQPSTPFWRTLRVYLFGLSALRLAGTAALVYSLGFSVSCPPGDLTPEASAATNIFLLVPVVVLNEGKRLEIARSVRRCWRFADVRLPHIPLLQEAQLEHDDVRRHPRPSETTTLRRNDTENGGLARNTRLQQQFWIGYLSFFGTYLICSSFFVEMDLDETRGGGTLSLVGTNHTFTPVAPV